MRKKRQERQRHGLSPVKLNRKPIVLHDISASIGCFHWVHYLLLLMFPVWPCWAVSPADGNSWSSCGIDSLQLHNAGFFFYKMRFAITDENLTLYIPRDLCQSFDYSQTWRWQRLCWSSYEWEYNFITIWKTVDANTLCISDRSLTIGLYSTAHTDYMRYRQNSILKHF